MKRKLLLSLSIAATAFLYAQTVTTYAGKVNNDYNANYELTTAELNNTFFSLPEGICFDASGNMYISERNKVRIVRGTKAYIRAGALSAPSFSEGYKNAGGTQATFRVPGAMVSDADGNIYVADAENHCIRKINKYVNLGNIQQVNTFAGAAPTPGLPGYGTDGSANGQGTAAKFNEPRGIAIDKDGYFYVADYLNSTIRKISPTGNVTTLAGSAGVEGTTDATSGSMVRFGGAWGVAILDDNNIVVTDQWNTSIRKVNIFSGATTTIAGPKTGAISIIKDGTLSEARFKNPKGVAVIDGIIYVGDENTIRAIDVAGNKVTTFAGNKGTYAVTDGSGSSAAFTQISDVTTDGLGNLYVAENSSLVGSSVIRKVTIDNLAPVANFSAPKRNLIVDEKVVLTDISGGQEASTRTWSVDKSTYTIHSGDLNSKNLEISFSATGFYEIGLAITNDYGNNSKSVEAYFSVSTTGSINRYLASNAVNVYPNPVQDAMTIELDASLKDLYTKVTLYNTQGQEILDLTGLKTVSTASLPNGSYFIAVVNANLSLAKKVIINH